MSIATQLLGSSLRLHRGQKGVVFVDENTRIRELEKALSLNFGLFAVTNRFDLANGLEHWAKGRVRFSDFDVEGFPPGSLDVFGLRVGKEKSWVHFAINEAFAALKEGGELHLSGNRTDGIKSYVEKAEALFGSQAEVKTTTSGARVAKISKKVSKGQLLDDKDYRVWRDLSSETVGGYVSKPGVFGWSKEDEGSRLLAAQLADLEGKSVLDLGCGYGYLSLTAVKRGAKRVVATDNCATAILLCRRNLRDLEVESEVVASDAGKGLVEAFDVIVCNPPFHQGKSEQRGLTRKFGRNMGRLLKPSGCAYVVVNAFIPFEKETGEFFSETVELVNDGKYKVIRCGGKQGAGAES